MSSDESLHPEAVDCARDANDGQASVIEQSDIDSLLSTSRAVALELGLKYAGGLPPPAAWKLVQSGAATLIDVRTTEERKFVGHVPVGLHVAWALGTSMTRNPRFSKEVEAKVKDKNTVIVLLCRSGKRSVLAGEVLTKAGFTNVFNVLEGFEGELDGQQHRGAIDGWRHHGLPWVQD